MKKFVSFVLAVIIFAGINAFAADAVLESGRIAIRHDSDSAIIWTAYDSDGKLRGSEYLTKEDGVYYSGLTYEKGIRYRLCDMGTGEFLNVEIADVQAPIATPTPEATKAPDKTAAPAKPTPFAYPAAYERELDARYTFSVVKNVEAVVDDGESAYKVEVWHCGEETEYIVSENVKIVAASDCYANMNGKSAGVLDEGDIVYFEPNSRGKIIEMAFIYRPIDENIMVSESDYGENFEKLISSLGRVYASPGNDVGTVIQYGAKRASNRYQYAFGAVMEAGNGYFNLFNRRGRLDDAVEVQITDNTIVYVCDMSGKNAVITAENYAAIERSYVAADAYDEYGNVSFTGDGSTYVYAFARIVKGIATEVVIYKGLGE